MQQLTEQDKTMLFEVGVHCGMSLKGGSGETFLLRRHDCVQADVGGFCSLVRYPSLAPMS